MPQGALVPLLLGGAAAAGSVAISKAMTPKIPAAATPPPLPQAPSPDDSAVKAQSLANKRRAALTQTVYTSPLGVTGQADVTRKTLTGQ